MKKYEIEIQHIIQVIITARNKEEAREKAIQNLENGKYMEEMCFDCYVSEGYELSCNLCFSRLNNAIK